MIWKALLGICIFISSLIAQTVEFRNYSVQEGLSNNKVNCVLQDKTGFIWFGTENGLNRFDGCEFKLFNPSSENNNIISNDIWCLHEDDYGNLWIGTKSGDVIKFDFNSQKFSTWKIEEISTNDNSVTSIYVDKKQNVWVGTYQRGLFKFSQSGLKLKNWKFDPNDSSGISNNFITSIVETNDGKIWISTYYGLNEFNPEKPETGFKKYFTNYGSLNNNLIWELRLSKFDKNKIWICTAGGVNYIDIKSKRISSINIPEENSVKFSLSTGDIFESKEGDNEIIYVATYGGLIRYDLKSHKSVRYLQQINDLKGLISNQINQMVLDKSGVLWLATENGISSLSIRNNFLMPVLLSSYSKLKVFNIELNAIIKFDGENILAGTTDGLYKVNLSNMVEYRIPQLAGLNIWSLFKDGNDNLWVGTYGEGLLNFNFKNNKLRKINLDFPPRRTQAFNYIKDIKKDSDGNLLIGTWGGGLFKIIYPYDENYELKFWQSNSNDSESISFNDIWSVLIDKHKRVWLGTNGGGLNYFDENENKFIKLNFRNSNNHLISNSIISLYEAELSENKNDSLTTIWICTDRALTKLALKNDLEFENISDIIVSSKHYDQSNGLTSQTIKSVVQDDKGNLWVGTSNGIFIYDKSSDSFSRASYLYERKSSDYNSGASLNFNNRYFLFGAKDGLKIFDISKLSKSDFKPNVVISDFQLFNKSFRAAENSPIVKPLNYNGEIELSYNQNIFSFQFSSTDYNNPTSIKYAYILKGFDKDWIYSDDRRFVTYTNLNPGEYDFMVKATNSDGVWSENAAIVKIKIYPPWWRTIWAYFIYIFLFLFGILTIRKLELNRAKLLNNLRLKEFEAEKLREIEEIKSRFFANISHELRTPLMLIKGPLDELFNYASSESAKELTMLAIRNSNKLKTLIDQLLELAQLDSAQIPVKASRQNIVEFCRNIIHSFKNLSKTKQLNLIFESAVQEIYVLFDSDILEKILNNLLHNAIKFTNQGGNIGLNISTDKNEIGEVVKVTVFDTGIGIDEKEVSKVFNRFYQVADKDKKYNSGFGIGLSLLKELVELHKWKIELKSKKSEGSNFILTIPLYDYLDESQIVNKELNLTEISIKQSVEIERDEASEITKSDSERPVLMIVEDSEDVRYFLSSILKDEYNLIVASNGKEAIEKSVENLPDLIISDIMMPEMDGLEFCKIIKSDWKTSHIPIILLTARATISDKLEGLELGADDYIIKPFDSRELKIRIRNLLEQRRILKEKFRSSFKAIDEEYKFSLEENEFFQKATRVVEENIVNPQFNTEQFAELMYLSRSQLHRKLLQLTNETPGQFMRTIRLKYAAKLLLQNNLNITQIALEVGFNSPSHFTKAFKQFFGCTPSEFLSNSNY